MSQMPEIKAEVNKEPEKKKKGGLLARLFGGGGSGGSGLGGLGGVGAGAGEGLGGLAGGGLLATKAGLLALILVGTTVAGGIGMLGYRLFGPGGSDMTGGDNLALFAPKPKDVQNAEGAPKDGTSASLSMLSGANTTPKEADASASEAPKDATAASATSAASGAGAAGGAAGPINKAGDTGNGVNKGLLKNVAKLGALSAPGGGGGGGASANSAAAKAPGLDASKGTLSSMKKGSGAAISGGTSRSLASRKFGGAAGQAFGVQANNRSAASSAAAGATYDGAATGGSNIGGGGTPIGGAGTGAAAGGAAQPQSLAGPADSNTSTNIPTPTSAPACPWQSQIDKAQMLIGVATALLLACSLINKTPTPVTKMIVAAIGAAVAAIGILVVMIGAAIAHGPYGQILQGGLLGAAGAGLGLAGAMVVTGGNDTTNNNDAVNPPGSGGGITGMSPFILLGGGLALVGLVGTMMKPPTTYPAQDANDPNWPKGGLFGYQYQQQMPSEQALKKMIA